MSRRMIVAVSARVRMSVRVLLLENFSRKIFFAVRVDVHLGGGNAAPHCALDLQPGADVECGDCVFEKLGRHSSVYQRAEKHVAADAGKTVEVGYAHNENRRRSSVVSSLAKPLLTPVWKRTDAVPAGLGKWPAATTIDSSRIFIIGASRVTVKLATAREFVRITVPSIRSRTSCIDIWNAVWSSICASFCAALTTCKSRRSWSSSRRKSNLASTRCPRLRTGAQVAQGSSQDCGGGRGRGRLDSRL